MPSTLLRAALSPPGSVLLMRLDLALRVARAEIDPAAGDLPGLYELDARLRAALGEGEAPGTGDLVAAAALQCAALGLIAAWVDEQPPGALQAALASAPLPAGLDPHLALAALSERFDLGPLDADDAGRIAALLLLALARDNPAMGGLRALCADPDSPSSPAGELAAALQARLQEAPPLRAMGQTLPALLRQPAERFPGSLSGQVAFAIERWGGVLPEGLLAGLLRARDVVEEQTRPRGGGPGEAPVMRFEGVPEDAGPRFTRDRDWMPELVLIAKQTYVWLDQLSRRHGRAIVRLDQVPDEELDALADAGFTGLWLIGLWERSAASREIKRRMGNPEAESSAYALYDYAIAERLGGEAALDDLRARARARGLRMAADMVPNHVGIDGRWVIEHPEWFLQLDAPPYPGYAFTGPDLCADGRVSVRLEDGYWDHSDAAVVFEHRDHAAGRTRYIYHGNDGTQMPWNDTAQLDYLNPDARRAVIDTIIEVARRFPVIRFDAAMTLARRHVQRLWYPEPGSGGAIPSRAERGLTRADFDRAMPREFWREVVERVQAQAPDTLLLAEAFWMMEGYFVRTLGMHRVYNSAFMHMLRDEETGRFRDSIKNVLAYSPAILERFVNFMNNPDEETAVEQFGRGDKYFGVATVLATLPGLPMFGHGQIEGFAEKYGMEYARAYRDEQVDEGLVAWHRQVIFPLLRRRRLFSGVRHFNLYDLVLHDGRVDEHVLAWSNRTEDGRRSIVLFNNHWEATAGRIHLGAPVNVAEGAGQGGQEAEGVRLARRTLAEALGLRVEGGIWYGFKLLQTGRSVLRSGAELAERGLYVELGGYGYQVLWEVRELRDDDGSWAALAARLGGAPVDDLDVARAALMAPTEAPEAAGRDLPSPSPAASGVPASTPPAPCAAPPPEAAGSPSTAAGRPAGPEGSDA